MKILNQWAAFAVGLVTALHASAFDGTDATRNLFTNLQQSPFDIKAFLAKNNSSLDIATVMPSLVRGVYVVQERNNGKPIFFTNASGTLMGGSDGVWVVAPGQPPRAMSAQEHQQFSAEVMENIRYENLLKVSYGNGGGRRIVMFSAINCPACTQLESGFQKFEAELNRRGSSLNTTLYVVPSSLETLEPNGWNSWKVAASLWCTGGQDDSWRQYWSRHVVPAVDIARCMLPTLEAARSADALHMILSAAVGRPIPGVPALVREDATLIDSRFVKDFSAQTLPTTTQPAAIWLADNASTVDQKIASRPIGKPDSKAGRTIKLTDIFKGLTK